MPLPYFPLYNLPRELFECILDFLNILDAALLSEAFQSVPRVCECIRNHVRRRTTALFNKLGDLNVVTDLILRDGMVVSGSRALAVAQPSVAEFVWNSDIDLYAPFGKVSEIDEYLRGQRFTAVRRHPAIDGFDENGYEVHRSGIHSVTTYTKGRIVIRRIHRCLFAHSDLLFPFHRCEFCS